jgi:ligand-binding SRPBCC domain-containing protein
MAKHVFEHHSILPTTAEHLMAFHASPKAFAKLTPPPIFVRVHRNGLTSLTSGEVDFTLWFGPIPAHWIARHEPGPIETSFVDRQVQGPLQSWEHQHLFREVAGGVELTDHVEYEHREGGFWGIFTRLLFNKLSLHGLFFYRHLRTRWETRKPLTPKGESVANEIGALHDA